MAEGSSYLWQAVLRETWSVCSAERLFYGFHLVGWGWEPLYCFASCYQPALVVEGCAALRCNRPAGSLAFRNVAFNEGLTLSPVTWQCLVESPQTETRNSRAGSKNGPGVLLSGGQHTHTQGAQGLVPKPSKTAPKRRGGRAEHGAVCSFRRGTQAARHKRGWLAAGKRRGSNALTIAQRTHTGTAPDSSSLWAAGAKRRGRGGTNGGSPRRASGRTGPWPGGRAGLGRGGLEAASPHSSSPRKIHQNRTTALGRADWCAAPQRLARQRAASAETQTVQTQHTHTAAWRVLGVARVGARWVGGGS